MRFEIAYQIENQLGEGPVWSGSEQALYWVDILGQKLQRWQPTGGQYRHWRLPSEIGSYALLPSGAALVALRDQLAVLDLDKEELRSLCAPLSGQAALRFNDGKCDPAGRFWVGSMDERADGQRGALYCLDLDGRCRLVRPGVGISNGLGWSPDQRTMYYTDSRQHTIYAYDFNLESGSIANERVFARTPSAYVPDGLCVDARGFVWSAMWDGWKVVCFAPDGQIEQEIQLPVQRPTSCCFGGPALQDLFITSARVDLSPAELASQPLAGSVLVLPGIGQGAASTPFLGQLRESR